MYKPDDEILELSTEETETTLDNDINEPAAQIDPPIDEAPETPAEVME